MVRIRQSTLRRNYLATGPDANRKSNKFRLALFTVPRTQRNTSGSTTIIMSSPIPCFEKEQIVERVHPARDIGHEEAGIEKTGSDTGLAADGAIGCRYGDAQATKTELS